ncbi:hypothetical protein [Actinoplanes sp. NPDC020271]|uniref:hypothetical protein n=1 Tax=Actinoplanes sp. NPDC020271 TaxID=3363896 RepID=UPI0037B15133
MRVFAVSKCEAFPDSRRYAGHRPVQSAMSRNRRVVFWLYSSAHFSAAFPRRE